MKRTSLVFTLALLACDPAFADQADAAVIGNTPIALPDTVDLVKSSDEAVLRFVRPTLKSGRRLLAVWIDRQERVRKDPYFPDRGRYAVSWTLAAFDFRDATSSNFAQVKRAIREDIAKLQAGAESRMPESLAELRQRLREKGIDPDKGISFSPAVVKPLSDTENQFGHLILVPTRFTVQGSQDRQAWLLLCSNYLLVRRKVVTVDVFGLYFDHSDSAWVTKECNELAQSVLSANR